MSIGGRFGYDDDGETPNTHIAFLDYEPAPIIQEVRGLPRKKDDSFMNAFSATTSSGAILKAGREGEQPSQGVVIECADGWVNANAGVVYDNGGRIIKEFTRHGDERAHLLNFVDAVRSRRKEDLRCEILEGHLSTSLSHLANTSYLLGKQTSPEKIRESVEGNHHLGEAFGRFQEHLDANLVDLEKIPVNLGPWLQFDPEREEYTGDFADQANPMLTRDYREPFVVAKAV